MEKNHPKEFLEIKYLPKEYKSYVTTIIYGDKVGIQSLQEDNIYVTIIKDKMLAKTYKNYFDILWKIAKK